MRVSIPASLDPHQCALRDDRFPPHTHTHTLSLHTPLESEQLHQLTVRLQLSVQYKLTHETGGD